MDLKQLQCMSYTYKYVYGQKNRESHIEIVSETAAFKFREASVSKLRNYLDI